MKKNDIVNNDKIKNEYSINSNAWLIMLMISLLFSFSVGLFMVWMSVDRTELAYNIYKAQNSLESSLGHITKLEVERDSILSPYELDKRAKDLGLVVADPGQIRRISE